MAKEYMEVVKKILKQLEAESTNKHKNKDKAVISKKEKSYFI